MHKTILLLICSFTATLYVRAQTTPLEQFVAGEIVYGYGLKGGIGLSIPHVDEWTDRSVNYGGLHERVGLQLGAVVMLPLNGYWVFRPELNYSSQGFKLKQLGSTYYERRVKQNYLQLPLMLQFAISKGVAMYTGPKVGYMVNNSEGFKRGDLAWDVGFSSLNTWNWGFDLRYSSGFLNIAPDHHPALARVKNKVLQVGLIYLFTVKRKESPQ